MKKSAFFLSLLNLALLAIIGFFLIRERLQAPERIFARSVNGIVEVRAVAGDRESAGSAVVISAAGELITNFHVVTYNEDGERVIFEEISVRMATEEDYHEVEVIRTDADNDLALLRVVDAEYRAKLKAIALEKGKIENGETCYAIGNMASQGISISQGIISNTSVRIVIDGEARSYIQAEINIAAGSSGGALLNERGKLIGITTLRLKDQYGNPQYGYGYSIPVSVIVRFLNA